MDNNQQTNRQKLVFYLMEKGLSNEEVAQTLSDVAEAALEEFTNEAMALFSDDDKKAIEAASTSIDADDMIKKLYQEKSGHSADEQLDELIEKQAISYMSDASHHSSTASGIAQ